MFSTGRNPHSPVLYFWTAGVLLSIISVIVAGNPLCHNPLVDTCHEERNCSRQIGTKDLICTVGHLSECRKAQLAMADDQAHASPLGADDFYPFLSSIEIYDRPYEGRRNGVESLRFSFRLPATDLGAHANVRAVVAEFYEDSSTNHNPCYNKGDPPCRYFDFSASAVSKADVESSKAAISYGCIGVDLVHSTFVLRLQSIPASLPLEYVISWTPHLAPLHKDPDYYDDAYYYDMEESPGHRVVAVAHFPEADGTSSLHVVVQPPNEDVHVIFFDVYLLSEPGSEVVQRKLIQIKDGVTDTFFSKVQPGRYKVEVKGHCMTYPCPVLLSVTLQVEHVEQRPDLLSVTLQVEQVEQRQGRDLETKKGILKTVVFGVCALALALCLALVAAYLIRKGRNSQKVGQRVRVTLTSLADRPLEKKMSEYFDGFLHEILDAEVKVVYPCMPPESASSSECSNFSVNDPLCGPSPSSDNFPHGSQRPLIDTIYLAIILRFSYSQQDLPGIYGQTPKFSWTTANVGSFAVSMGGDEASLEALVERTASIVGKDHVVCVTFSHQSKETASSLPPSSSEFTRSSRPYLDDEMQSVSALSARSLQSGLTTNLHSKTLGNSPSPSMANVLSSDPSLLFGVPHLFLPADKHRLYLKLQTLANRSGGGDFLDFDQATHLVHALEIFNKASSQPYDGFVLQRIPSIETLQESCFGEEQDSVGSLDSHK